MPFTIPNYLADHLNEEKLAEDSPEAQATLAQSQERIDRLMGVRGGNPHGPSYYHRQLGDILYHGCGVSRNVEDLKEAITKIRELREDFWANVRIPGEANDMNQVLEYGLRVADYLDLGELMCVDALDRDESCGCLLYTSPSPRDS